MMHRVKDFGDSYVHMQGLKAFCHRFVAVATQPEGFQYTTFSVKTRYTLDQIHRMWDNLPNRMNAFLKVQRSRTPVTKEFIDNVPITCVPSLKALTIMKD